MKVSLTGFDKLDRTLEAMPKKLRDKAVRQAAKDVAKLTLRTAKQLAPHDTGALENSLKVRAAKKGDLAKALRTSYRSLRDIVGSTVQTADGMFAGDQFYGGFLEFGTQERQNKSGASRGRIEPGKFDFLRPALFTFVARKRRVFVTSIVRFIRSQNQK